MAMIVDGMTAGLMTFTIWMESMKVGNRFSIMCGLIVRVVRARAVKIRPIGLVSFLFLPLDSSGSRYWLRLAGIMLRRMKNWKPSWYSPRALTTGDFEKKSYM